MNKKNVPTTITLQQTTTVTQWQFVNIKQVFKTLALTCAQDFEQHTMIIRVYITLSFAFQYICKKKFKWNAMLLTMTKKSLQYITESDLSQTNWGGLVLTYIVYSYLQSHLQATTHCNVLRIYTSLSEMIFFLSPCHWLDFLLDSCFKWHHNFVLIFPKQAQN